MSDYQLAGTVRSVENFCRLRIISGLTPRPAEAARQGLPDSCYGIHILYREIVIGIGRIVGNGALNMDIVDVAVDPAHHGKGLGRMIMKTLTKWLDQNACDVLMSH